jgi:hypothetical protein
MGSAMVRLGQCWFFVTREEIENSVDETVLIERWRRLKDAVNLLVK